MFGLPFEFDFTYLLILMAVAVGVILLLWLWQRLALRKLARVLYAQNDVPRYNALLDSAACRAVLRRSTVCILRLEGAVFAKDGEAAAAAVQALEAARPRPAERLNAYQKALSFAALGGDKRHAREYLGKIEALLQNEKDPKLAAVRDEARLLVGVYVDKSQKYAPALKAQAETKTGAAKGTCLYRLAKLSHYAGNDAAAEAYLLQAQPLLAGTAWQGVVARALLKPEVLEDM